MLTKITKEQEGGFSGKIYKQLGEEDRNSTRGGFLGGNGGGTLVKNIFTL